MNRVSQVLYEVGNSDGYYLLCHTNHSRPYIEPSKGKGFIKRGLHEHSWRPQKHPRKPYGQTSSQLE